MPKQLLTGSLEEQCAFLYQLAQEKMETGNYAGASHALREIIKYAPEYENAAQLLAIVKQRQAEQRNRLLYSLLGAVLFVCIGSFLQISSDLVLLALAVVGLLVGYGAANVLRSFRRS